MTAIFIKALGFLLIIALGFLLKQRGVVKKEDANLFSTIVMNITLPCALLSSASSVIVAEDFYIPFLLGIGANLLMDLVGYVEAFRKPLRIRRVGLVQISGYNIGTFTLPFVQAFFPTSYLATVLLFDTGNALMVLGGNYTIAASLNHAKGNRAFGKIVKNLVRSVPLVVYLGTFALSATGRTIPDEFLSIARIAGDANPFLAMLMLGILVDIRLEKSQLHHLIKLVAIRVSMSLLLSAVIYFFFPFSIMVRQMLMICICSPISVVAPVYAVKLGAKDSESANLNSVCILTSLCMMLVLLFLFL